jgi:replicative DNA helicase
MRVAMDETLPIGDVGAQALSAVADAVTASDKTDGLRPASDFVEVAREEMREVVRIARSGVVPGWGLELPGYETRIGRIPKGQSYVVLAARPSNGKTAFALHTALCVARQGGNVGIFSLEMGGPSLIRRMVSSVGRIPATCFDLGDFDDHDLAHAERMMDEVASQSIYIDDASCNSPARMTSRIRQFERRTGSKLDFAMIDYIQIADADKPHRERHREVATISKGIQVLAKEMKIPVMALAQLGRDAENSKPTLSNLRESGAIEQDADMVIALHRNRDTTDESAQIPIDVIVLKNRNGRVGEVTVTFDRSIQRFY